VLTQQEINIVEETTKYNFVTRHRTLDHIGPAFLSATPNNNPMAPKMKNLLRDLMWEETSLISQKIQISVLFYIMTQFEF